MGTSLYWSRSDGIVVATNGNYSSPSYAAVMPQGAGLLDFTVVSNSNTSWHLVWQNPSTTATAASLWSALYSARHLGAAQKADNDTTVDGSASACFDQSGNLQGCVRQHPPYVFTSASYVIEWGDGDGRYVPTFICKPPQLCVGVSEWAANLSGSSNDIALSAPNPTPGVTARSRHYTQHWRWNGNEYVTSRIL